MAIPDFLRGMAITAKVRLLIVSVLALCMMAIPTQKLWMAIEPLHFFAPDYFFINFALTA